jgi:hypothetical protein
VVAAPFFCGLRAMILVAPCLALFPHAKAQDLKPFCADRPGKGTSACTLDDGHIQVEVDAFDANFRPAGAGTSTYSAASPTIKFGFGSSDIGAGFAPYIEQRGKGAVQTGHGDLYLRAKLQITDEVRSFSAVVQPFVKIATATRGLGNGAWETGVAWPLSYTIADGWALSSTPEVDALLNASGAGRHVALMDTLGLTRAWDGGFAMGFELWTLQDFDSSGHTAQYSLDLSIACQTGPNAQVDAGINYGLNPRTPSSQAYIGYARRF